MIGAYTPAAIAPVVAAALAGAPTAQRLGVVPYIVHVERGPAIHSFGYLVYCVLGVVCAVIGIVIMRAVGVVVARPRAVLPGWGRPIVGGLLMAVLAAVSPQVLSAGHSALHIDMMTAVPLAFVATVLVMKSLASIVSLGFGFRGGLFFASLFLGTLIGHLYASQVEHALASVGAGEVTQFENRIIRPGDGAVRRLRDTSFPLLDDHGAVTCLGGIVEGMPQEDGGQVYIVSTKPLEARRLAALVRSMGYRARTFENASAFLDIAAILAPGCVLVDLRRCKPEGLSVPRELKARAIALPSIVLDGTGGDLMSAVTAMKAGATDYIIMDDEAAVSWAGSFV